MPSRCWASRQVRVLLLQKDERRYAADRRVAYQCYGAVCGAPVVRCLGMDENLWLHAAPAPPKEPQVGAPVSSTGFYGTVDTAEAHDGEPAVTAAPRGDGGAAAAAGAVWGPPPPPPPQGTDAAMMGGGVGAGFAPPPMLTSAAAAALRQGAIEAALQAGAEQVKAESGREGQAAGEEWTQDKEEPASGVEDAEPLDSSGDESEECDSCEDDSEECDSCEDDSEEWDSSEDDSEDWDSSDYNYDSEEWDSTEDDSEDCESSEESDERCGDAKRIADADVQVEDLKSVHLQAESSQESEDVDELQAEVDPAAELREYELHSEVRFPI